MSCVAALFLANLHRTDFANYQPDNGDFELNASVIMSLQCIDLLLCIFALLPQATKAKDCAK